MREPDRRRWLKSFDRCMLLKSLAKFSGGRARMHALALKNARVLNGGPAVVVGPINKQIELATEKVFRWRTSTTLWVRVRRVVVL